jgi:hypothetical protein
VFFLVPRFSLGAVTFATSTFSRRAPLRFCTGPEILSSKCGIFICVLCRSSRRG